MRKRLTYPLLLTTAIFLTGCSIDNETPVATFGNDTAEEKTIYEKQDDTKEPAASESMDETKKREITADYLLNHAFQESASAESISYRMYQEADAVLSNGAGMELSYSYMVDEYGDYFHQYGKGDMKIGASTDSDVLEFYGDAVNNRLFIDGQWSIVQSPLKDTMIIKGFPEKFTNASDVNFDGENYTFSAYYVTGNCIADLTFDKNYNLTRMDIQDGSSYLPEVLSNLGINDVTVSDVNSYRHSIEIDLLSVNNTPKIILPEAETNNLTIETPDEPETSNNGQVRSARMDQTFAEFYFGTNNITAETIMKEFGINDASLAYNALDTFTNYTKEELIAYINENYKYMNDNDYLGVCAAVANDYLSDEDFYLFTDDALNGMLEAIDRININLDAVQ